MNQPFRTSLVASLLLIAFGSIASAQQLTPLTGFGTNSDGTIRPGDEAFLTSDGSRYQRGMAYNPVTGHVLVVNRSPIGSETINILDGVNGTNIGTLDLCCPAIGGSVSFAYNMIAIADDGAIYVGNLSTSGTLVQYLLYRWASETNSQTLVYFGDPRNGNLASGNSRWGDTLAVRGSGTNTEVLVATQSGTLAAILRPTDETMATFTATTLTTSVPGGGIGYALAFGPTNTFFGKGASSEGEPLYFLAYNLGAGTTTTLRTNGTDTFPGRVGAISVLTASNQLAAIEMTVGTNLDFVRLYDISNPTNAPVFLDRKAVGSWTNGNTIFAGAVAIGQGNVYGLNSDNGLAAFSIAAGSSALAPAVFGNPASRLSQITSNTTFTVGADGAAPLSYQWLFYGSNIANATSSSLALTNIAVTNAGNYSVVITNDHGSVTSSVALLTVLPNFGDLLIYDPFAYTVGTELPGQGGWTMTSVAANGVVEAGNLDVPGLAPTFGNRYTWTASSSVRKPFGQYSAGEVYASFAFRLDTASTSTANETFAGFSFGTSTAFPLKVNIIGNGAGGYQLGLYKGGGTTGNGSIDTGHTYAAGQTVFVVIRYTFRTNSTTDDTCDMWVNPDPSTFGTGTAPTATIADAGAGAAETSWSFIDRFFWRWASGGYTKRVSDELRVGFSWAEVTPPGPPALSVAPAGASVVLSWPTNSSSGYVLQSNPNVTDSGGWETANGTIIVQGNKYTLTTAPTGARLFYRLKK